MLGCSLGPADSNTCTFIEQITDLSGIEKLHERLHEVNNWKELLALPDEETARTDALEIREWDSRVHPMQCVALIEMPALGS